MVVVHILMEHVAEMVHVYRLVDNVDKINLILNGT